MTSEEIKSKSALDVSSSRWLQEIAYQLALLNEKKPAEPKIEHRKQGR